MLAIEADPEERAALERALRLHVRAEVLIVATIDAALDAIARFVPDLILTSTFLPLADEARLTAHLRRCPETSHTRVITLPQFVDPAERVAAGEERPSGAAVVLRFARRPRALVRRCDAELLGDHIESYLKQARALRLSAEERCRRGIGSPADVAPRPRLAENSRPPSSTALVVANERETRTLASTFSLPRNRRRASRHKPEELPCPLRARLAAGGDIRLVDISSLGILLETRSELTPGSIVHLQVLGGDAAMSIAARLVRTELARASGSDLMYRVAAAFAREIDLSALHEAPGAGLHPPKVLGELLGRVLSDAHWMSNSTTLWSKFEDELRRLVSLQDVRIRAVAATAPPGCNSVCFDIPDSGRNGRLILQAIFDRGRQPCPVEVRLLKAAAGLASVVLELASTNDA
jgi:CheY-like chemotaxis protein